MADCSCAYNAAHMVTTPATRIVARCLVNELAVWTDRAIDARTGDPQPGVLQRSRVAVRAIDDGPPLIGLLCVRRRDLLAPGGEHGLQLAELQQGFELAPAVLDDLRRYER